LRRPGVVLDVEVDAVEPVRAGVADEVLDELRPVGVVAGEIPVLVGRAANRDERRDAVIVRSGNPGGGAYVNEMRVQPRPVLRLEGEQDSLRQVVPWHVRGEIPTKVERHDDTS
jgi:hypothetical protein